MATYTLTADGSTAAQRKTEVPGYYEPTVIMVASGDFGSGTLTVEYSVDGTTWVEDGAIALTDEGVARFSVHPLMQFRATLANATNPDIAVTFLT